MIQSSQGARRALWIAVGITVALYLVPFGHLLGYPLVLFSTFAHEMGHGLAAMLVGGSFVQLEIFADASGLATHRGVGDGVLRAVVAAGGLVGPAMLGALFFVFARRERNARIWLGLFGVFCLVTELLWVRTALGWVFVGLLGGACLAIAYRATASVAQTLLVFLAVQLSLSVFSRADYLFVEKATVGGSERLSDTGRIADALVGPYWLWGAMIALFSVAVLAAGVRIYLRSLQTDS